ncbi:MAG: hypothetical protein JXO22_09105 [Phycisphaerae bacterium]|nr:hypothetical protein [Phycisphaerae bacterium]
MTRADPLAKARAAMLLEVILALAIMVSAMAVLGAQLTAGFDLTIKSDRLTRASALADRIIGMIELDLEMQQSLVDELQNDGDFGEQYPEYMWRLTMEPLEDVEAVEYIEAEDESAATQAFLALVTIEILYQPDEELWGDLDSSEVMYTVHLLKASPPSIDLERDFGIEVAQIEEIQTVLPDFDPTNINPQELITMLTADPEALLDILPAILPLIQTFASMGGGSGQTPDLSAIQELLGGGSDMSGGGDGGGGSEIDQLMQLRDQLMQEQGGGGGGGGGGGARRGAGTRREPVDGGGRGDGATPPGGRGGGRGQGGEVGQPHYTIEDLMEMRDQLQRGER